MKCAWALARRGSKSWRSLPPPPWKIEKNISVRRPFATFFSYWGHFCTRGCLSATFSPYGGPFLPCGFFCLVGGSPWGCPPPPTKISAGPHRNEPYQFIASICYIRTSHSNSYVLCN